MSITALGAALGLALGAALGAPAAAPPGFTVVTPSHSLRVQAALEVSTETPAPPLALRWRREGAGLLGSASDERLDAAVRIEPGEAAGFGAHVEVRWKRAVEVERLALRLRLPGAAQALRRDLVLARMTTASGPQRVDIGTPVLVLVPGLVLVGGPGLIGAVAVPVGGAARAGPAERAGGVEAAGEAVEIALLLDDAGAHPFAVYESCLERLPALRGPGAYAALEHKRSLARTRRARGDRDGAAFQLVPVTPGVQRPLVMERWPEGARAALVFTDHADRTDPAALRAVLFGGSNRSVPGYGTRGLVGRGLRITKSFFAADQRGGLLDDPDAAALAEELAAAGSEVAIHSPGTGADDREAVRRALKALASYGICTWIDHQPYTNCEAFSALGWQAGGRWGIRDLLVEARYRWVWEANDLGGFSGPRLENLMTAARAGEPSPPVYPLPIDPRLWVFQSTFFYGTAAALGAAFSDEALDALERAGGLFVGHTYLSASARTTREPEHLARLAVREGPGGTLEIAPELDAGLARAERRLRRGTMVAMTLRDAGDRLRALSDVHVVYLADGSARVENHGVRSVRGLTLSIEAEGALEVEQAETGGHVAGVGRSRVFFDIGPGEALRVQLHGAVGPAHFLAVETDATLTP